MKEGDKVLDTFHHRVGVIVLAYNGEYEIRWENGMSGSFKEKYLEANGIVPFYDTRL